MDWSPLSEPDSSVQREMKAEGACWRSLKGANLSFRRKDFWEVLRETRGHEMELTSLTGILVRVDSRNLDCF